MKWKNSEAGYGVISRGLHWVIALGFVALYVSVYFRHWFTVKGEVANQMALVTHTSVGITVLFLVIFRVANRLIDRQPEELGDKVWELWAARCGHLALYLIMIVMPLTGYLGTKGGAKLFGFIPVTPFPQTGAFQSLLERGFVNSWEKFEDKVDLIHEVTALYIIPPVLLIHVIAVLYHVRIKKDGIMERMVR